MYNFSKYQPVFFTVLLCSFFCVRAAQPDTTQDKEKLLFSPEMVKEVIKKFESGEAELIMENKALKAFANTHSWRRMNILRQLCGVLGCGASSFCLLSGGMGDGKAQKIGGFLAVFLGIVCGESVLEECYKDIRMSSREAQLIANSLKLLSFRMACLKNNGCSAAELLLLETADRFHSSEARAALGMSDAIEISEIQKNCMKELSAVLDKHFGK